MITLNGRLNRGTCSQLIIPKSLAQFDGAVGADADGVAFFGAFPVPRVPAGFAVSLKVDANPATKSTIGRNLPAATTNDAGGQRLYVKCDV